MGRGSRPTINKNIYKDQKQNGKQVIGPLSFNLVPFERIYNFLVYLSYVNCACHIVPLLPLYHTLPPTDFVSSHTAECYAFAYASEVYALRPDGTVALVAVKPTYFGRNGQPGLVTCCGAGRHPNTYSSNAQTTALLLLATLSTGIRFNQLHMLADFLFAILNLQSYIF